VNSTLVISVISAVAASTAAVTLQNARNLWLWFRKTSWKVDTRIGRWWTRNEAYVCHHYRAPDFKRNAALVPWYRTGPYWLNSPPPGYPADGPGPRDLLGRPMRPDMTGPW
jgi:hypothetical protein